MPRLFFGLAIPDDIRSRLQSLTTELKLTGLKASWVPPENMHFTMKFLGEIPRESVPRLTDSARDIAARVAAFSLAVAGAGVFPNAARPRVLWAGGRAESDSPQILARDLDKLGERLGVRPESRPFTLHATIARVRPERRPPPALSEAIERFRDHEWGSYRCACLTLYQSEIGRGPARYATLATLALG